MKPVVHAIAGTTAMLTIATSWASTLVSELFLDHAAIVTVKHSIVIYGLAVLVLTMAITGSSGFALGKTHKGRLLKQKKKRMSFIGGNGLLVMIPSALFLYNKAAAGEFDEVYYMVQSVELLMGLVQLTLMALNFRDGLKLTGKPRPQLT